MEEGSELKQEKREPVPVRREQKQGSAIKYLEEANESCRGTDFIGRCRAAGGKFNVKMGRCFTISGECFT